MNPLANKNAATINQTVVSAKPDKASAGLSTFSNTLSEMLVNAMAPMGIGFRMKPTIVATKMANKCQACAVIPAGIGPNQMPAPTANVANDLMTFELKQFTPAFF
jgi:hypothetical protein